MRVRPPRNTGLSVLTVRVMGQPLTGPSDRQSLAQSLKRQLLVESGRSPPSRPPVEQRDPKSQPDRASPHSSTRTRDTVGEFRRSAPRRQSGSRASWSGAIHPASAQSARRSSQRPCRPPEALFSAARYTGSVASRMPARPVRACPRPRRGHDIALSIRVAHAGSCGTQRFVFLTQVEVDGATGVLGWRAQRSGGAGPTIRAAEASMDARAPILTARDAPSHGDLALWTGHLFVLPVDDKLGHDRILVPCGIASSIRPAPAPRARSRGPAGC